MHIHSAGCLLLIQISAIKDIKLTAPTDMTPYALLVKVLFYFNHFPFMAKQLDLNGVCYHQPPLLCSLHREAF